MAPTTRVERHVIAPTPIREIASRRIVASRPTPTTSPNTGRRFAALVSGARLILYEGATHGLMITHPGRLAADIAAQA